MKFFRISWEKNILDEILYFQASLELANGKFRYRWDASKKSVNSLTRKTI